MSEEADKYYTPTIEEFHVGFGYEQLYEEWEPSVYSETSLGLFALHHKIKLGQIRIKSLDHEDIVSEGWEEKHGGLYLGEFNLTYFAEESAFARYSNVLISKALSTVFVGTIKNRSELKKVMKMIGIETAPSMFDQLLNPGEPIPVTENIIPKDFVRNPFNKGLNLDDDPLDLKIK